MDRRESAAKRADSKGSIATVTIPSNSHLPEELICSLLNIGNLAMGRHPARSSDQGEQAEFWLQYTWRAFIQLPSGEQASLCVVNAAQRDVYDKAQARIAEWRRTTVAAR